MDKRDIALNELECELRTDFKNGLSEKEAEKRLIKNGKNIISENKKNKSIFIKFLMQFSDFMVIALIIAAIVSFVVSKCKVKMIILTL